ncbi:glycosyltransferase family 2 protein [Butyrivibrio sp. WCE2006]|uniref:glycosyltransferase family 2 protein n=1 Tax=Butyrivibrio sp. WCE2006 TaxID=1410611 RepID=UPI0006799B50|nr:glycosyltransferase family A protein [Butyrivibrio sp. WCE2006]
MISVIVPVYNVEQFLRKCIDSIIFQDYEDIEVILIDDGSTDGSGIICDEYEGKDSRIRVIHQDNKGLAATRKIGVEHAKGEFIAFIDSDDWIERDYFKFMFSFVEDDVDLVTSNNIVDENGISIDVHVCAREGIYDYRRIRKEILPVLMWEIRTDRRAILPTLGSKIFKKDLLWDSMKNVDDRITIGEDAVVTYPYIEKCKKLVVTHYMGYHYVQHGASIMHAKALQNYESLYLARNYLNDYFESVGILEDMQEQIDKYISDMLTRVTVKTYGFNPSYLKEPFSCNSLPWGKRIVLYGAAKFGKDCYRRIASSNYATVVGWLDKNIPDIPPGREVSLPEEVVNMDYDYVLITVRTERVAREITTELKELGVDPEKIVWCRR